MNTMLNCKIKITDDVDLFTACPPIIKFIEPN